MGSAEVSHKMGVVPLENSPFHGKTQTEKQPKMKVGIVTYHRSHNYGTMLQAHALRMAITGLGHEAAFVDYWPDHQRRTFRLIPPGLFSSRSASELKKTVVSFFRTVRPQLARRRRFNLFFRENIAAWCRPERERFDVLVFGSDQIWRKQPFLKRYNPVYFGRDSFNASRRISYAASMGDLPETADDAAFVRELLAGMDALSVREEDLRDFLAAGGLTATATADPVFLPQPSLWLKAAGDAPLVRQPYLLYYDLQRGSFDEKSLYHFAKAQKLKVIRIVGSAFMPPTGSLRSTDGPYEFLNLFRHASAIATSSFHGLAFAILFQKPFFASFSKKASRAKSLLRAAGLEPFLLPTAAPIPVAMPSPDWENARKQVSGFRDFSLCWLGEAISGGHSNQGGGQ